jgi:hypothetical protein
MKQIFDGFVYGISFSTRPQAYSAYWMGLGQMEAVRRAAADYRSKWIVVPDSFTTTTISARNTFYYQGNVAQGSYLYGWNFTGQELPPSKWSIQVTDTDLKIPLFNAAGSARFLRSPSTSANVLAGSGQNNEMPPINLLTQPRLVFGSGGVEVEIANNSANNLSCQVVLYFAEPRDQPDDCAPSECKT